MDAPKLSTALLDWVPLHLRRVRLAWAYLLGTAMAVYLASTGVYHLATDPGAVYPGFLVNRRLEAGSATSLEARRAGIRVGDRIIAVDGEPVSDPDIFVSRL